MKRKKLDLSRGGYIDECLRLSGGAHKPKKRRLSRRERRLILKALDTAEEEARVFCSCKPTKVRGVQVGKYVQGEKRIIKKIYMAVIPGGLCCDASLIANGIADLKKHVDTWISLRSAIQSKGVNK